MVTAPLMVTVRNARGRALLDAAVAAGHVEVLQRGGHGGRGLPSEGERRAITMKTVQADGQEPHRPRLRRRRRGVPPWLASVLADVLARTLPKGMEFGRYRSTTTTCATRCTSRARWAARAPRATPA